MSYHTIIWPGKIVMPDGIYKDKSTGLWYYTAHGVTYTGFGSYQEVVEWLKT